MSTAAVALTPRQVEEGWAVLPAGVTREVGVNPFWRKNPLEPPWVVREPGRREVPVRDVRLLGASRATPRPAVRGS